MSTFQSTPCVNFPVTQWIQWTVLYPHTSPSGNMHYKYHTAKSTCGTEPQDAANWLEQQVKIVTRGPNWFCNSAWDFIPILGVVKAHNHLVIWLLLKMNHSLFTLILAFETMVYHTAPLNSLYALIISSALHKLCLFKYRSYFAFKLCTSITLEVTQVKYSTFQTRRKYEETLWCHE